MISLSPAPLACAFAWTLCALLPVGCAPPGDGSHRAAAKSPLLSSLAREARTARPAAPSSTTPLGAEASTISFERMARYPEPGQYVPRAITYAPDGKRITYLQSESGSDKMAMYLFDPTTRQQQVLLRAEDLLKEDRPLSREEELR